MRGLRGWTSVLKGDAVPWLLGEDNPSVRYFTLTDVLQKSEKDPEMEASKKAIMQVGVVPRILAKQKGGGYWGIAENFYVKGKYKGTVWQLIVLGELGAEGRNEAVKKACEFVLENSQNSESGGFSCMRAGDGGGAHGKVLPCLTGNMV